MGTVVLPPTPLLEGGYIGALWGGRIKGVIKGDTRIRSLDFRL